MLDPSFSTYPRYNLPLIFKYADANKDGKLATGEFIRWITSLSPKITVMEDVAGGSGNLAFSRGSGDTNPVSCIRVRCYFIHVIHEVTMICKSEKTLMFRSDLYMCVHLTRLISFLHMIYIMRLIMETQPVKSKRIIEKQLCIYILICI